MGALGAAYGTIVRRPIVSFVAVTAKEIAPAGVHTSGYTRYGREESMHVRWVMSDLDLAGVEVGDLGEGLLGEVDGALAPVAACAFVHDLHGDVSAGARVTGPGVRCAGAP